MSKLSQFSSKIKSIQRGEVNVGSGVFSGTATISVVDPAKSVIIWLGHRGNDTMYTSTVTLTNSTTVTATSDKYTYNNAYIGYQVVEYY